MHRYGYIRVSTKEQNPDRQFDALQEAGIKRSQIYVDYQSGKDFQRPEYQRLIRKLKESDLLVIKSVDRLGRDYGEILDQWRLITKTKKAHIEVLDMPLLNTKTEKDGLTGVFISDLVLQILAYFAETERKFIRQRQAEGIAAAQLRGVHFGRKQNALPTDFREYVDRWKKGEISMREAAESLQMSTSTFFRRCHEMIDQDDCFKG